MKTSDFDYALPPDLIAQQPLPDRAASRMLVVDRATGEIRHDRFRNIGQYLRPGDLLVLNDTKVIPARIWAKRPAVELLLVERVDAERWTALVKPGRRAKVSTTLQFEDGLSAVVQAKTDFGGRVLRFSGDVNAYLAAHGAAPLPPYIKRATPDAADLPRYQTVFAQWPGAVAAPTAGLHFTNELLRQLGAAGVERAFITLHVGIGTFQPVKVQTVEEHKMHGERFSVSAGTAEAIGRAQRVVAVGTTVVRALESLAELRPCEGTTNIFIRPPFQFRFVDVLLTNFHLPRSTLLMLVSAFASRELVLRAYEEAVTERYRFFSYGDCMLIL
ncbi:MAG TPA: tRNA preQ1(34) S-adenosylmethionine ribosyltransferase-isomerase QueA [Verrucomicrobiae bacterium]|nr:tRNA preQ1(34) S-adenosylmethionine ribosyltransferase-isomerase QueA [Verrucomicrobiae bacterium]